MAEPRRLKPGPQVGIPPSLEQVPVTRLSVDPAYQRATDSDASRRIIAGMVREWNWTLCQPLVVARRVDGSLWVLDGQHRLNGALERGDIPFVPCVISSSLDHETEARTFVELNTKRQRLTQGQIFHGMLAAGDADAKAVQQLLDETGWRVVRHDNQASYKPGDLQCAPMLVTMLAKRGHEVTRFALTVIRAAWPDKPVRQSSTLIKAVVELFDQMACADLTASKLIAAIGAIEPARWIARAIAHQEKHPALSQINALAAAMLHAAQNSARPAAPAPIAPPAPPPWSTPPPQRPIPVTNERLFGTTGKGWCTQCEALRTREAARACTQQFCKLRAHA